MRHQAASHLSRHQPMRSERGCEAASMSYWTSWLCRSVWPVRRMHREDASIVHTSTPVHTTGWRQGHQQTTPHVLGDAASDAVQPAAGRRTPPTLPHLTSHTCHRRNQRGPLINQKLWQTCAQSHTICQTCACALFAAKKHKHTACQTGLSGATATCATQTWSRRYACRARACVGCRGSCDACGWSTSVCMHRSTHC